MGSLAALVSVIGVIMVPGMMATLLDTCEPGSHMKDRVMTVLQTISCEMAGSLISQLKLTCAVAD